MAFPTTTIQQLPLDVLREIALHALPIYPYPSVNQAPLSLSRVSSAWRTAVFTSPQLWKMLYLRVTDNDRFVRYALTMKEWFQRAGALHLSFFLDLQIDIEDGTDNIGCFLSELSKVMEKVRHFGIKTHSILNLLRFVPAFELELPQLAKVNFISRLELDVPLERLEEDFVMHPPLRIFDSDPDSDIVKEDTLLQELIVVRRAPALFSASVQAAPLPWSQLTTILLGKGIPIQHWIGLMDACPRLCSCSVFIWFSDPILRELENGENDEEEDEFDLDVAIEDRNLEEDAFVLWDLETLNIGVACNRHPWLKLLSLFKLPALRHLRVFYDNLTSHESPYLEFPDPIDHPALRNLRTLTLNAYWINLSDMVEYALEILRETVNLEELSLEVVTHQFRYVFEAMSYDRRQPIILRRLKTLKLWVWEDFVTKDSEDDGHIQALIEMLESRKSVEGEEDRHPPDDCQRLGEFWIGTQDEHLCEALRKNFDPLIKLKEAMRVHIDVQPAQESNQLFGDSWLFTDLSWQHLL